MGELLAIVALTASSLGQAGHEGRILALVLCIGVARAFQYPAMQSMVPALVPPSLLPRAMAANASASQAAAIVGPALGGFLYVAGPPVVYGAAAMLYLVAAILVGRLRTPQAPPRREPATMKIVFAGVHFIGQRPDVLGAISLDLFAVLLGGATALLPIFARDILHTGPWGLGLLRAAPAAGALLMSLWLAQHTLREHVGMVMYGAVAGFGVATVVFAVSTRLWLSLLALFALGAFDMVSVVIRGALVQLETPDAMRGRVSAVNAIFIDTSSQLGEFESGMLAAWLGAMHATLVGGIGTLLVVGLWMVMFPTLRRRQTLEGSSRDGEGPVDSAA
jgi:MFS family permease